MLQCEKSVSRNQIRVAFMPAIMVIRQQTSFFIPLTFPWLLQPAD